MDISSFYDEWDDLSKERKRRFLTKLFSVFIDDPNEHEKVIWDILSDLIDLEADDYFGTEGFDG